MKRIQRKPVLLSKSKVKKVRRVVDMPEHVGGDFYSEIVRRNGSARVCVIRSLGGIGDVLMATPALRELKRRFPNLHLTLALDRHRTSNDVYYALVCNASFVDQIIDARYVNHGDFDAVTDISAVCVRYERSDLPSINRINLFARKLGVQQLRNTLPFYRVEALEAIVAKARIANFNPNGGKVIALHTASFEDKRSWPIQYIVNLIKYVEKRHPELRFIIFDFNKRYTRWREHKNVLDCSQTNLREMAALIAEADLYVGPDSGPMHIAGAVKTMSLVLFGSIPPEARINHYKTHTAIQHPRLSCLGCWYASCPYNVKCMRELDMMLVYNQMITKLGV